MKERGEGRGEKKDIWSLVGSMWWQRRPRDAQERPGDTQKSCRQVSRKLKGPPGGTQETSTRPAMFSKQSMPNGNSSPKNLNDPTTPARWKRTDYHQIRSQRAEVGDHSGEVVHLPAFFIRGSGARIPTAEAARGIHEYIHIINIYTYRHICI